MIRVVLDTNVVVSALLFRGPTSRLVSFWQEGRLAPLISKEIFEEYLRVLGYPKFHLTPNEVKFLAERQILPFAEVVQVKTVPSVIKEDPTDDVFLACAATGRADFLVSGDWHLLLRKKYEGITIISVNDLLVWLSIREKKDRY